MTEDYVSFEVAKLLKDKEFNVPVKDYYRKTGSGHFDYGKLTNWNDDEVHKTGGGMTYISCPTQALACKWLREKYGIHIYSRYAYQGKQRWFCQANIENQYEIETFGGFFGSEEQAINAALLYTLQNLIK